MASQTPASVFREPCGGKRKLLQVLEVLVGKIGAGRIPCAGKGSNHRTQERMGRVLQVLCDLSRDLEPGTVAT